MGWWEKTGYFIHGFFISSTFVSYLTFSIISEDRALFFFAFLLFIAIHNIMNHLDKKNLIKIICLGVIFGYLFNTFLIYRDRVDISYPPEYEENENNNQDAYLFVLPTYPSTYSKENVNEIIRNTDYHSNINKKLFMPFLLYKYKQTYKIIGQDSSERISMEFMEEIKKQFPNKTEQIYFSYLNHPPFLEEQIINIFQEGAENIHVMNILLDQSEDWFRIQERIEKVRYYNYDTQIYYNSPFWQSSLLKEMFISKIEEKTKEINKKNTGILFVGQGNKNTLDGTFSEATNQQIAFSKDIKESLIVKGFDGRKIKISFMMNEQYSVKKILAELLDQGVNHLVIVPIYIPFDNIVSEVFIPGLIKSADIPSSIQTLYISSWNTHPKFIQEVCERLEEAIKLETVNKSPYNNEVR